MLNVAIKAARAAGAIINRAALDVEAVRVTQKTANDFVTEVDQNSEQAIIDTLLIAYPDHGILAEESGQTRGNQRSDFQWIIDPLDGTTNFIHGFPQYCVSIALQQRGQVTQAVVYDPTRNDLFTASKGGGAYLNEKRIRVTKAEKIADALIGTGFPYNDMRGLDEYVQMFRIMTQACSGLRRPGAAALDLAYVACGRLDGFFEKGLKPWDVAAGSLLITEAGGIVGTFAGESDYLYKGDVLAGTPKVFAQMVQLLAPFSR
jgi:myo-inositol-1(or 4)-monophosphatase